MSRNALDIYDAYIAIVEKCSRCIHNSEIRECDGCACLLIEAGARAKQELSELIEQGDEDEISSGNTRSDNRDPD